MKGDEAVEARKAITNRSLFGETWNQERLAHEIRDDKLVHHRAAFRGLYENRSHHPLVGNVVLPEWKILLNNRPQTAKPRRHKPVTCVVEHETAKSVDLVGMSLKGYIANPYNLVSFQ